MSFYEIYQASILAQANYALNLSSGLSGSQLVTRLTFPEAGMSCTWRERW